MPQTLTYNLDINAPLAVIMTPTLMMQGDNMANRITAVLTDGGAAVDLTGWTALHTMERADGVRVTVEGTVEGNTVAVTLTDACYRVAGRYAAFLRITSPAGEKRTILRLAGLIESEGGGPMLDEENVIPSIDDIIAQLDKMETATNKTEAATLSATEAAQNANKVAQTVQDKLDSGELVGKGFAVLGYFADETALMAGVSNPSPGDAYGVGTADPYDIYIWDGVNSVWVNNGALQGAKGDKGAKGDTGDPGADGADGADGKDGASAARNLLDNGNFAKPVNQRESTSYSGSGYTIDRWRFTASGGTLTVGSGYITISGAILVQILESYDSNAVYTLAACDTDGNIRIVSGKFDDMPTTSYVNLWVSGGYARAEIKAGSWVWAALYKGAYTVDTLPEYIPRGYAAEYLECCRYYYVPGNSSAVSYTGYTNSTTSARVTIPTPVRMRVRPSISVGTVGNVTVFLPDADSTTATAVATSEWSGSEVALAVTLAAERTAWRVCAMRFNTATALSADL